MLTKRISNLFVLTMSTGQKHPKAQSIKLEAPEMRMNGVVSDLRVHEDLCVIVVREDNCQETLRFYMHVWDWQTGEHLAVRSLRIYLVYLGH